MKSVPRHGVRGSLFVALIAVFFLVSARPALSQTIDYEFNDSHFHLTNFNQEGPTVRDFLNMMGTNWPGSLDRQRSSATVVLQHRWGPRAHILPPFVCSVVLLLLCRRADRDGL